MRMITICSLLVLGLSVGCGDDDGAGSAVQPAEPAPPRSAAEACDDYLDAYTACVTEALDEDLSAVEEALAGIDVCGSFEGAGAPARDLFDCYAEVFDEGDCSTMDDVLELATLTLGCAEA